MDQQSGPSGWVVLAAWVIAAALGYFALGGYLYERLVGISASMVPVLPSIVLAVVVIGAIVLTVMWARRMKRREPSSGEVVDASGRRKFLTGGAVVAGGAVGVTGGVALKMSPWANPVQNVFIPTETTSENPKDAWKGATVKEYRTLGRTGLKVSDISTGTTRLQQNADPVRLLNTILDRGVNYIDASPDYAPESEGIIRDAIKGRDRSKLVIATKFCFADGHVRQGASVETYMDAMQSAVDRMESEYVDVAHIHACDTVDRLMDPNLHEAFDGTHPNLAGTYLAACVVYRSVYNRPLDPVDYDYFGQIDADTAAFLRGVAERTVQDFFGGEP